MYSEYSRYLNANWPNGHQLDPQYISFSKTWTGKLPDNGWASEFYPFLWLGNENCGLSWFAESDEVFKLKDRKKAIFKCEKKTTKSDLNWDHRFFFVFWVLICASICSNVSVSVSRLSSTTDSP
jgi:hypothetical protein